LFGGDWHAQSRITNHESRTMNFFISILFWAGIVLLVDGSLALLFQEKWQKLVGRLNIQRIALIEIGAGLVFLAAHYMLGRGL